jgi:hypothetical protein
MGFSTMPSSFMICAMVRMITSGDPPAPCAYGELDGAFGRAHVLRRRLAPETGQTGQAPLPPSVQVLVFVMVSLLPELGFSCMVDGSEQFFTAKSSSGARRGDRCCSTE